MNILVFKTDIHDAPQVKRLAQLFATMPGIHSWNVDLHDCDKVLRIEAAGIHPATVKTAVRQAGFLCEDLPD
jgi:hypothetical protein